MELDTIEPAEFAALRRDEKTIKIVSKRLRKMPESERFSFVDVVFETNRSAALILSRSVINSKKSVRRIVKRGLIKSDVSEMAEWLKFASQKMGNRKLMLLIQEIAVENPSKALDTIYWIPQLFPKDKALSELRKEFRKIERIAEKKAPNKGKSYEDHEIMYICKIVLERGGNVGRSVKASMASHLGRSPGAIDMIVRWINKANFPSGADNKIKRQVEDAMANLQ